MLYCKPKCKPQEIDITQEIEWLGAELAHALPALKGSS